MKKVTIFLAALFAFSIAFGQEKNKARVIVIKAKSDMKAEFEKGLAAHNLKYHPKATDPISIYTVVSGPHTGVYHYVQGPLSWDEMESKQYSGDHSADWDKNVAKFIESVETHYYAYEDDLSYNPNRETSKWSILAFIYLNPNTSGMYKDMMKTRKEALTKAKDDRNYAIYSHSFAGRDSDHEFVYASDLKGGLKDLDTQGVPLMKVLNDQIGPNASIDYSRNGDLVFKRVDVMLSRYMPELSSK